MDVATLILLGGAGGALRGLLDVYVRFLNFQSDRRAHLGLPRGQEGELPRFKEYFDPFCDSVAAVVHSVMGAAIAVLLGTTGQISGAYAAIVVGISAPVILTQLSRVQSVNEALTGGAQAQTGAEQSTPEPALRPESPAPTVLPGPQAPRVASADGAQMDVRAAGHLPDATQPQPQPNGRPTDAPQRRHGPVVGEEGTR